MTHRNAWIHLWLVALFAGAIPAPLAAQHEHPAPAGAARAAPADTMAGAMSGMPEEPLGIPHTREASGTAWLPDETPMYAFHGTTGRWELMLHGSIAVQYMDEGGDRGDEQFGSTNWIMGMAHGAIAGGVLGLHVMASLDPLTVGECGYPNLLATGEFCDGEPIHDRQHPHDLFMELSAGYERAISRSIAFQVYGGPVGEPALGPVAFPHRISALSNPLAPVAHHWLDSTHIAFGLVTAGVYGRAWKLEGSAFNGREPDEDRYDFDLAALDSYSGRLWILPSPRWALQVSAGRLEEAEVPPDGGARLDVTRATASATYHRTLAGEGHWASTAAWGRNEEEGHATQAVLVETNLNLAQRNLFFVRGEIVEKSAEDLVLEGAEEELFTVGKLAGGYMRQFHRFGGLAVGVGGLVSVSLVGEDLESAYGSSSPVGAAVFVRIRPAPMAGIPSEGGGMEGMQH